MFGLEMILGHSHYKEIITCFWGLPLRCISGLDHFTMHLIGGTGTNINPMICTKIIPYIIWKW